VRGSRGDNAGMRVLPFLLPLYRAGAGICRAVDRAVMPRRCVFCGLACRPRERSICDGCNADLPRIRYPCPGCARPLAAPPAAGIVCGECQRRPLPFARVVAPLAYEFPVDAAIKQFKFRRKLFYAQAFGELLLRASAQLPDDIDAVLPVPLHWLRHGARGFNQAAEICRPVRRQRRLPVLKNVVRVRATPYQSGLSAIERRRNLSGAFAVRGRVTARHVLIVDDVITTGETCTQLAGLLERHGAGKVSVLALARA